MDILKDPRVATSDGGYLVTRDDGISLMVLPHGSEDWAVYFGHATVEDPHPRHGMAGSLSSDAATAVEWALR